MISALVCFLCGKWECTLKCTYLSGSCFKKPPTCYSSWFEDAGSITPQNCYTTLASPNMFLFKFLCMYHASCIHHHHHHHHHILLSLLGHRASTKHRHLILFLASCLTSPQLFPSPNASLWTDLLHVCLGLPLFRCPCGFQSKTSLSVLSCPFLSVCPRSSRLYHIASVFSRLYYLGLGKYTLWCSHSDEIAQWHISQNVSPFLSNAWL